MQYKNVSVDNKYVWKQNVPKFPSVRWINDGTMEEKSIV